ncbi:PREDICTED: uncharacterized protein LOC104605817 isoform X3 [Nelumbo nucifera]|uniref:50S ribosomal protein L20 n=1 Tax=Nelumbo nucifera TaxID=4432 RepID=A0A1U8AMH6_NELNU|nr:PREDICTED: uncharacterized protein LOC104605817 isoform X3 [Nelumbo nucifera]
MNKDKIFKLAKGFRGRAKNCIRIARERVEKALQYSYRDRRNKKRDMRSLWIERINAGTRLHGVNYGNFMHGLMKENIQLNRKEKEIVLRIQCAQCMLYLHMVHPHFLRDHNLVDS